MKDWRNALFAAAAALGLTALSAPAAYAEGPSLGENLAGESCHAAGSVSSGGAIDIVCGSGAQAVGKVRVAVMPQALPSDGAARQAAILDNAKSLFGVTQADVKCANATWLSADRALFACRLKADAWPQAVILSANGRQLTRAQGLPSLAPVLLNAMAQAGGGTAGADEVSAAEAALAKTFSDSVLKSSGADFSSYSQFVENGRLQSGADNYAAAEAAYRHALEIETRLFGPDSAPVGETLCELALQVSNQGRFEEAALLFQRATPIIEASASATARARLASYRALDAANQRRFGDALKFAREATAERRAQLQQDINANPVNASVGNGGPVQVAGEGELAHSLRIEAEMALRLGDAASAQAAAEEALWIVTEEPGLPLWWRPDMVALMGEVNDQQGRVVVAERDYKDSLDLDRKLFGDTAPTALAELRLGAFYTKQQLYPTAVSVYRDAFKILAHDPVARAEITADQIIPFIAAASAEAQKGDAAALNADIFRASQLVKSDVASQTIARVAARQAAGDPALSALVLQLQRAQRLRDNAHIDLAAEYAKPDDERDAGKERTMQANLAAALANVDALNAQVTQQFPAYANLANPGPAELSDVAGQLQPGEALLSYVIGEDSSYALLVTANGLSVKPLKATAASLEGDVGDLRTAFTPALGKVEPFSLQESWQLYRDVLAPLNGDLTNVHHLIVVPGGALSSLPLSLLVTQNPGDTHDYSSAAWLIRRMAVSQMPSPRAFVVLRVERAHRAAAPRPLLAVGDPSFAGPRGGKMLDRLTAFCGNGPVSPDLLRGLPPLPDTRAEVQTVSATMGGNNIVLVGDEATEANLRAQPLDQFAVLYFATHGLLPGELRCQAEPGLALSPPATPAATTDTDGLLTASEISALKLNADLVVLSACNTAAEGGKAFGGGALEGLADAFFNAGARAVLASHWPVPSNATEKLMTAVVAHAHEGSGVAEALRQAQLALIADPRTSHPFDWAAFTLIGDGGAMNAVAADVQPVTTAKEDH